MSLVKLNTLYDLGMSDMAVIQAAYFLYSMENEDYVVRMKTTNNFFIVSSIPNQLQSLNHGIFETTYRNYAQYGQMYSNNSDWFLYRSSRTASGYYLTQFPSIVNMTGIDLMFGYYYKSGSNTVEGTYTAKGLLTGQPSEVLSVIEPTIGWERSYGSASNASGYYVPFGGQSGGDRVIGTILFYALVYYGETSGYCTYRMTYQKYNGEDIFLFNSYPGFSLPNTDLIVYRWFDGSNWIISKQVGLKDSDIGYWINLSGNIYTKVYTGGGTIAVGNIDLYINVWTDVGYETEEIYYSDVASLV